MGSTDVAHTMMHRVVVVVGGASGIGCATAKGIAYRGGIAVLFDRDQDRLSQVEADIRGAGGEAISRRVDVLGAGELSTAFEGIFDQTGRIDGLVNVVGGRAGVQALTPTTALQESHMLEALRFNLFYALTASQLACGMMLKSNRGGSIVNVASVAGFTAVPRRAAYGIAKAGLLSLTVTLASEMASSGIRVNAVSPGPTGSERINEEYSPEQLESLQAMIPMRRLAKPEEQASAILFLLSDAASYVTGQNLTVDGGLTLGPTWIA